MSQRTSFQAVNLFFVAIFVVLVVVSLGITSLLRNHGIDSCRDRGGTPITRSWLSKDAWDVSCIEVPHR